MQEVRPTLVLSVPRLFEKVYARVLENALAGRPVKRQIFFWAKRVGRSVVDLRLAGNRSHRRFGPSGTGLRTGSCSRSCAPAPAAASNFSFPEGRRCRRRSQDSFSAGMPVPEGYGLTETSPVLRLTPRAPQDRYGGAADPGGRGQDRRGRRGPRQGPSVMQGYYNKPDATAEAIDSDGWFHTGDIGLLDADGFLRITDRKKDLIVTAGGKNIAPQPIESLAKSNKFVANAVMLGDRRKFPIMLIVPNFDNLAAWAAQEGIPSSDTAVLVALPEVQRKMEREVQTTLRDLAGFEMPKKFLLLPRDFSIEGGELTPKLSVKRAVVERRNAAAIERLYTET